jgi:hypothetical protein
VWTARYVTTETAENEGKSKKEKRDAAELMFMSVN